MKEVIFLNIGSAGCNLAQVYWNMFCQEHGILLDGTPDLLFSPQEGETSTLKLMFNETKHENGAPKHVPRSLLIDSHQGIDRIRQGSMKDLFHESSMITTKESNGLYYHGWNDNDSSEVSTE